MKARKLLIFLLNNSSWLLFGAVFVGFGCLSSKFLDSRNLVNILIQSSSLAIVAIGMTFVLLTAGVDLSVGSIMFVAAAVAGKLSLNGAPLIICLLVMLVLGGFWGALNAWFITRLNVIPFVVTLATLYFGRGFALWVTQTREMNLPESFLLLGTARVAGVPAPLILLGFILVAAHVVLTRTGFGRQIYAIGHDREAARKAGIQTGPILFSVYVICGLCAALGGAVSLAQLGSVSPTFGKDREFSAIAAAVLGGTSLFGGRGQVFPGTILGAVLIQTVENGLNILNANPYLYPLVTSTIIFLAVWVDTVRYERITQWGRTQTCP
jgi:ribose transport system permease protein